MAKKILKTRSESEEFQYWNSSILKDLDAIASKLSRGFDLRLPDEDRTLGQIFRGLQLDLGISVDTRDAGVHKEFTICVMHLTHIVNLKEPGYAELFITRHDWTDLDVKSPLIDISIVKVGINDTQETFLSRMYMRDGDVWKAYTQPSYGYIKRG